MNLMTYGTRSWSPFKIQNCHFLSITSILVDLSLNYSIALNTSRVHATGSVM